MAKTIKERLAEKVNKDLEIIAHFEASDFKRNFGASQINDWCSWTAVSGATQISSWTTMTELANKKGRLVIIGDPKEIGPLEIA